MYTTPKLPSVNMKIVLLMLALCPALYYSMSAGLDSLCAYVSMRD